MSVVQVIQQNWVQKKTLNPKNLANQNHHSSQEALLQRAQSMSFSCTWIMRKALQRQTQDWHRYVCLWECVFGMYLFCCALTVMYGSLDVFTCVLVFLFVHNVCVSFVACCMRWKSVMEFFQKMWVILCACTVCVRLVPRRVTYQCDTSIGTVVSTSAFDRWDAWHAGERVLDCVDKERGKGKHAQTAYYKSQHTTHTAHTTHTHITQYTPTYL